MIHSGVTKEVVLKRMPNRCVTPKLVECAVHGMSSGSELIVVEGDSAARSVELIRDEHYQAVLPMQGKPINVMKAAKGRVEKAPLFSALRAALFEDSQTLKGLRFERIVLLFDPDADGIHCAALMLFYFYKYMPDLLESGRIHQARAPLMEFEVQGASVSTPQQSLYAYTDQQIRQLALDLPRAGMSIIRRKFFRGLANIPTPLLRQTCVDPATRNLVQLCTQDAQAALRIFGVT